MSLDMNEKGQKPFQLDQLNTSYPDRYLFYEMPYQAHFYGREAELEQLNEWIVEQACHFVLITGMGGHGKTTLATYFCQQVAHLNWFDKIIWQSLINAPTLPQVTARLLRFFLKQIPHQIPDDFPTQLHTLFELLNQQRCLLLFDNIESILEASGKGYQPGYEAYGNFLRQFGQSQIRSCLMLTGRETPPEVPRLLHTSTTVKVLSLAGVDAAAGQQLLQTRDISLLDNQSQELVARYSGNPLALTLIADTIQENFQGDTLAYLAHNQATFSHIQDLLAQQIDRLSPAAATILMWLAIERETVDQQTLRDNVFDQRQQKKLLTALNTLKQRSLIQISANGFSLQNVVMEYLSDRLINKICQEIICGEPDYLERFALMKAQSKDYVRQSQARIFLRPITERLISQLGLAQLEVQLRAMLVTLQGHTPRRLGYTAANLLHLLVYLDVDLQGADLSNLAIWQAYLQETSLPGVNFSGSDLSGSLFMNELSHTVSLAFNPTGEYLATAHQLAIVKLWRTDDLSEWQTFSRGNIGRGAVVFSPDDKLLAANGQEYSIYVWTYQTGETKHILTGHTSHILALAFSPDSQLLASGSYDQTVRLWDMRTGNQIATLEGHTHRILAIDVSPDGALVASGGLDHQVRVWSIETMQCLHVLEEHNNSVETVTFSPDGQWLASAGLDGLICLWNVETMKLEQTLADDETQILCVQFSPDGRYLAAKFIRHICLYHIEDGSIVHTLFTGDEEGVHLVFHPNGELLASSDILSSVHLWNIERGVLLYDRKSSQNYECHELTFSQDSNSVFGRILFGELAQWHLYDKQLRPRYTPTAPVENIAMIQVVNESAIETWTYPEVPWLGGEGSMMISPVYCPMNLKHDKIAIQTFEPAIWVVDMHTKQIEHRFTGHTFWFYRLAFSPDGTKFAASYMDRTVDLWDIASETQLHTIQLTGSIIFGVAFSADGRYVVCGQDDTLEVWEVATGQQTRIFDSHPAQNPSSPIIITADGTMVASIAQDHTILLWDFHTGQLIRTLEGHGPLLTYDLAFSPDDTLLASSAADETIRVWDVATGECLDILTVEGPYEGMNISEAIGLAPSTQAALKQLGAIDQP